jgi:uncharacterized repeat protein (TIGR03803 family)
MKASIMRRAIAMCGPALCVLLLSAVPAARAQTYVEHVVHNFSNFPQGAVPYGALARDLAGNLYGTTYLGGAAYLGSVFKIDASGLRCCTALKAGTMGPSLMRG